MTPPRRPTSADVARASGVSRATVSYVLNDTATQTISAATRERVLTAARDLGYVPSAAAASLRRGHSKIALLALDPLFSGHVADLIVASASAGLAESGFTVVRHVGEHPEELVVLARAIDAYGVIALTFITAEIEDDLQRAGVRRIVGSVVPAHAPGPPDRPWEFPVGQLQVDHLVSTGRDRLIYALPFASPRTPIAMERLRGARMECSTLGVPEPEVIELPLDRVEIARRLRALDLEPGRSGLCAYDDQIGIGVLGAMADLGLRAPDDLAVIGCDDLPVSSLVTPALTTVSADARAVGFSAARAFTTRADGIGALEFDVDLDYDLVVRASA